MAWPAPQTRSQKEARTSLWFGSSYPDLLGPQTGTGPQISTQRGDLQGLSRQDVVWYKGWETGLWGLASELASQLCHLASSKQERVSSPLCLSALTWKTAVMRVTELYVEGLRTMPGSKCVLSFYQRLRNNQMPRSDCMAHLWTGPQSQPLWYLKMVVHLIVCLPRDTVLWEVLKLGSWALKWNHSAGLQSGVYLTWPSDRVPQPPQETYMRGPESYPGAPLLGSPEVMPTSQALKDLAEVRRLGKQHRWERICGERL